MKSVRFLCIFILCLFFLGSTLFAGGLYITTADNEDNTGTGVPDNDMGSEIVDCIDIQSQIHPVEFNINVSGNLPVSSAYLSLFIKDVDWPDEQDEVFLNGHSLGFAGGQNNLDNSTLFVIPDLSWIQQGSNLVQIFVDQKHVSTYWCAEVQSGQLIFDDDTGVNTAGIRTAVSNASAYNYGENVTIDLEVDTSLATQDVRLELVLRDALGTIIGFDGNSAARNWTISGNSDEPYRWTFQLPASGQDGLWAVSITVYDVADSQFLTRRTVTFAVPSGAADLPPVVTSVSPDNCVAGEAKAVVIQGSNFIQGDTVCTVGGLPMENVIVVDNTRITGNVSSSLPAGIHSVVCTTSKGEAALANAFTVNPSPVTADFSADKTLGTPPLAVQFTDHSTGSPISWQWDFNNDGIIDSEIQNPVWTYSQEGIFTVALAVGNGAVTDTKTKTDYITVSNSVETVNLTVSDLRVPPSATSLNPAEIIWKIQNTAQGTISGSWIDRVYLSADNVLSEDDTPLGEFAHTEGLNADSSCTSKEQIQIPDTVTSGVYYIIIKTDSSETVAETSENDNVLAKQITIAKAKIMTAAPDQISLNLNPGVPVTGKIDISNICSAAISGITGTVQGASPNISVQVEVPAQLETLTSAEATYTVTASDLSVAESEATIVFAGSQGASAAVTFAITVIPGTPKLVTDPGYLEYGMLRGRQSLYEFEISNMGGAAAENLQVMIPSADWLTLVTPETIGNLAPGGKSKIGLMLSPSAAMALGPYSGEMLIKGSNTFLRVSFRFTAVSEAKGGLKITAKDEFSYFAEDHPNVKNAKVFVKDAFSDTVIAEGLTDDTGMFEILSVNEGRYEIEVSAEKHSTFHQTIEIVPGMVKEMEAFLARQLVTYRWSVVPVEIQDNYKVTLEAVFETHVPAPVVTMEPAFNFVPIFENETVTIEVTITNHGLIAAQGVTFPPFETDTVYAEPVFQNIGTLDAMTSVTIPVKVSPKTEVRSGVRQSEEPDAECLPGCVEWYYYCGEKRTNHACIMLKVVMDIMDKLSSITDPIETGLKIAESFGADEHITNSIRILRDSITCISGLAAGNIGAVKNCLSAICKAVNEYNELADYVNSNFNGNMASVPSGVSNCLCAISSLTDLADAKPDIGIYSNTASAAKDVAECLCNLKLAPVAGEIGGGGIWMIGGISGPAVIVNPVPCDTDMCNFSSDQYAPERCFGGVGKRCEGALGAPMTRNYDNCTIEGYMSVGSILHDRCCLRTNNEGYSCKIPYIGNDNCKEENGKFCCQEEWDEAFANTVCSSTMNASRQWKHTWGPYPFYNPGDDTTALLYAPSGTRVNPKYSQFCEYGCITDGNGNIVITSDNCGDYCVCK